MYGERRYFTWGCQPAKSEPVKNDSAIRESVKVGLLSILEQEREHIAFLIAAKKAQATTCDSFEEIAELVAEVVELEKSLQKIVAIVEMVQEV